MYWWCTKSFWMSSYMWFVILYVVFDGQYWMIGWVAAITTFIFILTRALRGSLSINGDKKLPAATVENLCLNSTPKFRTHTQLIITCTTESSLSHCTHSSGLHRHLHHRQCASVCDCHCSLFLDSVELLQVWIRWLVIIAVCHLVLNLLYVY